MMTDKEEKIVSLENDAELLVRNLKKLKDEMESYRNVTDKLNDSNKGIQDFIEETKKSVEQSHKIITELNKIGSSEILRLISENGELINENIETTKSLEISLADKIAKQIEESNKLLQEVNSTKLTIANESKKIFIMTIIIIIIGITNFFL